MLGPTGAPGHHEARRRGRAKAGVAEMLPPAEIGGLRARYAEG